MAIDRIGKGGGLPPAPDAGGPSGVKDKGAVERPFQVERPDAARPADAAQAAGSVEPTSPLARLRAGEIDVNGYVDLKVDEATKALHGLSPAELDEIKSVLRDQMKTDPGLTDLVRTATGKLPEPPQD
jgi:hypothetical protein